MFLPILYIQKNLLANKNSQKGKIRQKKYKYGKYYFPIWIIVINFDLKKFMAH